MYTGKTVFSQLMDFLPMYEFRKCVDRYGGNYHTSNFSCMDQYLCMGFAQLTYRESLRDIEACLRSRKEKLYHLGIRGRVSRSTLCRGKRKTRLANVCRLLSNSDFSSTLPLCRWRLRRRTQRNRLRFGFHYYRPLPVAFPLGIFPPVSYTHLTLPTIYSV